MTSLLRLLGTTLVVTTLTVPLAAHPGSTTTIAIDIRAGHVVDVTIGSDAQALIAKLEDAAGAPLTPTGAQATSPVELTARLRALETSLIDHLDLQFDRTRTSLSLIAVDVDTSGQATLLLSGRLARDAHTTTWSTPLVYGAYPVAVRSGGRETLRWLQGRESSTFDLAAAPDGQAIGRGVWLGFTHILPNGLDHILFVLGLLLLRTRLSHLFLQVSAFTAAHSMTLGLCLYGVVSLPSRIVEPMIALSVAYIGIENLFSSRLPPWRVAMVFCFGLLHGLGFAEALAGLNLSRADLLSTLISFNVGVELGQLTVLACAASLLYGLLRARRASWRTPVIRFASAAVGIIGLVWTVERLL